MEINAGFTLVGNDIQEARPDLTDAGPAAVIGIDQELYVEEGGPFEPGEHVGRAEGFAVLTHRERLVCHLTFSFERDEDDTIEVHGVLPREGAGIGGGRLAITGGTGSFAKAAGSVRVETRNPKRYTFSL